MDGTLSAVAQAPWEVGHGVRQPRVQPFTQDIASVMAGKSSVPLDKNIQPCHNVCMKKLVDSVDYYMFR